MDLFYSCCWAESWVCALRNLLRCSYLHFHTLAIMWMGRLKSSLHVEGLQWMSAIVDSSLIYQIILCLRTARLAFKQKCPWTWCVRMCMFCFRRSPYIFCFKRSPCMFCFGRSPFIFALGGHPLFFSKRSPFMLFQEVTLCFVFGGHSMFCFWRSPPACILLGGVMF